MSENRLISFVKTVGLKPIAFAIGSLAWISISQYEIGPGKLWIASIPAILLSGLLAIHSGILATICGVAIWFLIKPLSKGYLVRATVAFNLVFGLIGIPWILFSLFSTENRYPVIYYVWCLAALLFFQAVSWNFSTKLNESSSHYKNKFILTTLITFQAFSTMMPYFGFK